MHFKNVIETVGGNVDIEYGSGDGFICHECANNMQVCPSCGRAFASDDFTNFGDGFCYECKNDDILDL